MEARDESARESSRGYVMEIQAQLSQIQRSLKVVVSPEIGTLPAVAATMLSPLRPAAPQSPLLHAGAQKKGRPRAASRVLLVETGESRTPRPEESHPEPLQA
jgi:hypothetical protein